MTERQRKVNQNPSKIIHIINIRQIVRFLNYIVEMKMYLCDWQFSENTFIPIYKILETEIIVYVVINIKGVTLIKFQLWSFHYKSQARIK